MSPVMLGKWDQPLQSCRFFPPGKSLPIISFGAWRGLYPPAQARQAEFAAHLLMFRFSKATLPVLGGEGVGEGAELQ